MSNRRIVHLGLGNFHRAHQAVYTQLAGDDWSICGVAHRNRQIVDALRAQDMRYHVLEIDRERTQPHRIDVVTEATVLADDAATVVDRIADPATAIVTLTVTEAGYGLRTDGELDLDDPDRRADLDLNRPPRTALGALAHGLARRAGTAGPITVVSCDNLSANGEVLRRALNSFAAATSGSELADYLAHDVGFPSTMVDRIVPATTDATRAAARKLGLHDEVPVPAEPFRQWVLQPDFRAGRPGWDRAGAVFTEDVHAWETVKVRLLNGSHSLIAYLGLLSGHALIADAFADPDIRHAVDALGEQYLPTLSVPAELDIDDYRADLARRFANPALGHRCAQVGTDGSLKLAQRVPDAALWWLTRHRTPDVLALLVAAFCECLVRPGELPVGERPRDPAADRFASLADAEPPQVAGTILQDARLFGAELAARQEFTDRVAEVLGVLRAGGVPAAVRDTVR